MSLEKFVMKEGMHTKINNALFSKHKNYLCLVFLAENKLPNKKKSYLINF